MIDFTVFYTNSKKKVAKLRIKNMLDSDEREMIAFLEKKLNFLSKIFCTIYYMLLIVGICFLIVCFFWMIKPSDNSFVCVYFIGILLFLLGIFILREFHEEILWYFIKLIKKEKNECDFLLQYLEDYREVSLLMSRTYSILSLFDARTSEGTLILEDPKNQAAVIRIVFYKTYLRMKWISYAGNGDQIPKDYQFHIEHVIKNCKLEEDTVEYDFMKEELRIPMKFDEIESAD